MILSKSSKRTTKNPTVEALIDSAKEPFCILCEKRFVSKQSLKRHLKEKHFPDQLTLQCDICSKTFHRANYVNIHKKMIHKI